MAIQKGERPSTPRPSFPTPERPSDPCASCPHRRKLHDTDWADGENWDSCAVTGCMCEHFEGAR